MYTLEESLGAETYLDLIPRISRRNKKGKGGGREMGIPKFSEKGKRGGAINRPPCRFNGESEVFWGSWAGGRLRKTYVGAGKEERGKERVRTGTRAEILLRRKRTPSRRGEEKTSQYRQVLQGKGKR